MKKLILLLSILLLPSSLLAQSEGPISLTTASATCQPVSNINCAILPISGGQNTIIFNIVGASAGTNVFEFSPDNQVTWRSLTVVNLVSLSAVSSTTTAGTFASTNPGYTHVRVRMSVTGTNTTLIRAILNNSMTGINFGGGGSTIGAVTQGAASDASNNWTVNCAVGCASSTSDADDASIAAGQTNSNANSLGMVYDGSVWRRLTLGQAVMNSSLPVTLSSNQSTIATASTLSAETTKVIGTVNLSAAQTLANVTTLGTLTNALPAGTNVIGHVILDTTSTTIATQATGTNLHMVCDSGCSGGTTDTDDGTIASGQSVGLFGGLTQAFDGTNWKRLTTSAAGSGLSTGLLTIQGNASGTAVPVSGTVTATTQLPTAAAAADNMSNPTAPFVLAALMCYDGSTWDRCTDQPLPAGTNVIGHIICDSGCSGGTSDTDDGTIASGQTVGLVGGLTNVFDGTNWKRFTVGTAGTASAQVVTVQGIASGTTIPVTGTITAVTAISNALPAGTNLLGKVGIDQTTPGTTNAVSAVITTGSAQIGHLEANQSINLAQANGVTLLMNAGGTGTGSPRVTEANDSQLSAGVGATGDAAATVGSTGSLTAKGRLMTTQLDAIQTAVQLIDNAQTGDFINYHTSVGTTEDETEIKGTAGTIYSVAISNTNAAARFFRCANLTAANTTPGTSTVFLGLAIPGNTAGAGFTHVFGPNGVAFSTALTCWVVTGAADTDVAEVAANEIKWDISYK